MSSFAVALVLATSATPADAGREKVKVGEIAPDFTLTDQHGETVRLSDMQGAAVALAFIFTTCPDVCPAIAAQLRAAWDELEPALEPKPGRPQRKHFRLGI